MANQAEPVLLKVSGLRTEIHAREGVVRAVSDVSFEVRRGESVGIVGESGSGKSMTCMSILRLLPVSSARTVAGSVVFDGVELLELSESRMRKIRGAKIAMVMQDPMAALNPVLKVGDQVAEPIRHHLGATRSGATARVIDVLSAVKIPTPERRLSDYPHQFSGGMRQRIVAAMGLGPSPSLLVADEPTTALDVTIQAQFIAMLRTLQRETNMAMIWVTHDLGVVAKTCDRVNVMYAGRIVESGTVREVLRQPLHPYTKALIDSIPKLGSKTDRLRQIDGQPPDLMNLGPGCPFFDRCPARLSICREVYPEETRVGDRAVSCWVAGDLAHA